MQSVRPEGSTREPLRATEARSTAAAGLAEVDERAEASREAVDVVSAVLPIAD